MEIGAILLTNQRVMPVFMLILMIFSTILNPIVSLAEVDLDADKFDDVETLELDELDINTVDRDSVKETGQEEKVKAEKEVAQSRQEDKEPIKNKGDPVKEENNESIKEIKKTKEPKKKVKQEKTEPNKEEKQEKVKFNEEESEEGFIQENKESRYHELATFSSNNPLTKVSAPREKVFSSLSRGNFTNDMGVKSYGWIDRITEKNPNGGALLGTRVKQDDNKTAVYCLNWDLASPDTKGTNYVATNEKVSNAEYTAMVYGYDGEKDRTAIFNKQYGFNKDDRYYVTQFSLYLVTNDKGSKKQLRKSDIIKHTRGLVDESKSDDMIKAIKNQVSFIEKNILSTPKEEKLNIDVLGSKGNDFVAKNGFYETEKPVQVKVDNIKGELKLDKKGLNGGYFVDKNGKEMSDGQVLKGQESFLRIDYKDIKKGGKVSFKVTGDVIFKNLTKYASKNPNATDNQGVNYQRITWVSNETISSSGSFSATYDDPVGDIKINKQDSDNEDHKLSGAEFTVYNSDGKEVAKGTTSKKGTISFNLPVGKYSVKETKAPKGYNSTSEEFDVEITTAGQSVTLSVENDISKGSLVITKTDVDTNKPLSGVKFEVRDSDGNKVGKTQTTNEKGQVIFEGLKANEVYSYHEVKAKEGYIKNNKSGTGVEIKSNGEVVKRNVTNEMIKGSLEITKKETGSDKLLSGAEFEVLDSEGEVIDVIVTDEKGIASIDGLIYGEYSFKETKAPEGHVNKKDEIEFVIDTDGQVSKHEIFNDLITGDLKILKIDKDTGKPLADAEFEIVDGNGKAVDFIKTNEEGFAKINLPYGKYQVTEIKSPKNYILSDISEEFEVKDMNQLISFTFDNKVVYGDVELIKRDNVSGEFLEGVEFEVTTIDGKVAKDVKGNEVDNLLTNEKGYLSLNLPYGEYTIKEIKTIEGYVLGNFEESFEITEEKTIFSYEVENRLIKGSLEITKKETGSDKLLSEAEFEVLDSEDDVIDVIVTDENGIAYIDGLIYGEYSLKETKAPEGHVTKQDETEFVIDTDGQVNNFEVYNGRVDNIPQTGSGTDYVLIGAGLLLLALGGYFVYRKKKLVQ